MHRPYLRPALSLATALCLLIAPGLASEIFLLNSFSQSSDWAQGITDGVRDGLTGNVPAEDIAVEYLDSGRRLDEASGREVVEHLAESHAANGTKLLMAADDEAYQLLLRYREEVFGNIPLVFCGVNDFNPTQLETTSGVTGVLQIQDVEDTIELALRRRPDARRLAVIHDDTPAGRGYRSEVERLADDIKAAHRDLQILFLSGRHLTTPELIEVVKNMAQDTVILMTVWSYGRDRSYVAYKTIFPLISRVSSVPVYGVTDFSPGLGSTGGSYEDGVRQGREAAQMALQILAGVPADQIPIRALTSGTRREGGLALQNPLGRRDGPAENLADPAFLRRHWRPLLILALAFVLQACIIVMLAVALFRLQRTERRLHASRELNELIVDSAKLGVFDWDLATGRVVFNVHYAEMLGYAPDELEPTVNAWEEMIHPEDRERVAQTLENYLEDQSTYYQAEYRLRTRSGRYMWIMGRGEVALRDEHGTPLRMTGVHIDIDERMRAQAKLEKRKESLDRLVKQKTERLRQALRDTEEHAAAARDASTEKAQLLARLAREFRSPIAHIAERLGDLANTSLSPEQKRIADDLRKTGGAMHAVTDDMLELYCIESGKIELDHTAFDLRKCLEETMRTLNTLAEQKGLDLLLRYPPRIPSMVRGDNHRFGQIFLNLVGRAIAFTECGHVLVTVNTSEEDDTSARFVIRVQGSSEAQNQENSRAADAAQARWPSLRRYGRTGIGLYIARGLAELMDAELDPERRSGTGTLSRFAVTLPVLAAPDIETLSDGLAASPVLIVSDRPLTSRLSGEALSQRGFRNVTGCRADNAAALLSRAEQSGAPIRLVLVDLKWSTRPNATVQFAGTVSVTGSSPLLAAVIPASCDTRILRDAGYRTCLRRPVFPEDVFDCVLDLLDTE